MIARIFPSVPQSITVFVFWLLMAEDASPGTLVLAGAIAYVFAPYHIIDDFVRGSMGETAAYMLLPLVALCLQRTARGEGAAARPWIAGLGLAYGGLLMCHVTIALLASISVLPAYGLHLLLEAPTDKRRALIVRSKLQVERDAARRPVFVAAVRGCA